ncbi:MAG TPA: beta-ketoacyl synthase N-terminal-like domain-containing protein, partial [Verrucomicrobiae bacterium]|nr:beta-ketoacyl synthase N-terminal-like domain-containing protein [Verrucomicrobiae bacterium]
MVPSVFVPLEALPHTPNNKIDRKALPEPTGVSAPRAAEYVAPQSRIELLIADIWKETLRVPQVGVNDNFFDAGGHSLLMTQVNAALRKALQRDISMVEMFQFPTIRSMALHLGGDQGDKLNPSITEAPQPQPLSRRKPASSGDTQAIAIIGMSGRFPDAPDLESFWRNLRNGVESIRAFSDEELAASGVPPEVHQRADYVRRASVLEGAELFDPGFFGITPREAEILDPQHRLLLECAWEAFEDAGYDPARCNGQTGVFAGCSLSAYLWRNLASNPKLVATVGGYQLMVSNDKDFLATRISYKLGLKGPGITVQTACSTSLVAVQLACQSLLSGQCDLALAGGASIRIPQKAGYIFQDGMIMSPDGHCRAFDARAAGTVSGEGVGLVLLKRLSEAIADRDVIHAVILGSAINNDGSLKAGYTAPSVDGQAQVIAEALAQAGVSPDTVSYVEAHGTGTVLGDPIEVAALAKAYPAREGRANPCAIGSLKTNLGHLDVAAGVASLIKTVLALKYGELPPSLNFQAPNPKLGLGKTRFRVNHALTPWPRQIADSSDKGPLPQPRRAGVSSFGIGGTNAHAVLEEAPVTETQDAAGSEHLLVFSGRTEAALDRVVDRFARHLEKSPSLNLADASYTLQAGRRAFPQRSFVVCKDATEAGRFLQSNRSLARGSVGGPAPRVVFMFSGQGSQQVGMGSQLYEEQPVFRRTVDKCLELLKPHLSRDLREVWLGERTDERATALEQTELAQPALFVIEYAL